jgi:UDP-2,3-diacylglucosamine pyrophosphatase LpxH
MNTNVLDAVILSDIHLGSSVSQAKHLVEFLHGITVGKFSTKEIVLNGDVFDSIDFRRLDKHHWKVLSLIRKLSDKVKITWVSGNHDGPAEIVSHLLGVDVINEYSIESGGRRVLILHGHSFDDFIDNHPFITWLADITYRCLQYLDPSHRLPRKAKHNSKTFLRCMRKIKQYSIEYAGAMGYEAVCCGHTHHPEADITGDVHYYNSGSWTEYPSTYLTIHDGVINLETFAPVVFEHLSDKFAEFIPSPVPEVSFN